MSLSGRSRMETYPLGTRVKIHSLTGTVSEPDAETTGQPCEGYQPPYPAVWVYLDEKHHGRMDGIFNPDFTPFVGPTHGMWIAVDQPCLSVLDDGQ